MNSSERTPELVVVPSGVSALDEILPGGFLQGGVYIIEGAPGAGKTILANQICFNHVAESGCAAFVTLLAESHTRMLQHLRSMSFYDESAMPDRMYYISGFDVLERDGLKGLVELLRREIKTHKLSLIVLDGFSITHEMASSHREFKRFVQEVQSHAAAAACTVVLLSSGDDVTGRPESTMVDGVIELNHNLIDMRTERTLQVLKFRGRDFLPGCHPFRITERGIVIFPRIETAFATPSVRDAYRLRRHSTGVRGIDDMLNGGLLAETTNGLFGPTGIGKTTFGLQYISLSNAAEPGTFFTFFESPERLRIKAETMGIDLRGLEQRGDVEIIWRPQGEHILDELGHELVDSVQRRGVKRLFIDGYGGLAESAANPERLTRFISTLANELRALKATTVVSIESRNILGASMELPSRGLSSLLEGLMVMRYAEVAGQVRRIVSVTKLRDSDFDPFLHDFRISGRGIEVGETFAGTEALLSGFGRQAKAVPQKKRRRRPGREE